MAAPSWEEDFLLGKQIVTLIEEKKFSEAKEELKKLIQSPNGFDDLITNLGDETSKEKEDFVSFYLPHSTQKDFFQIVEFLICNKLDLHPAVDRIVKFSLDEFEPYNFLMTEYIIELIHTDPKKMSEWIGDEWDYLLEMFDETRQQGLIKYLPKIIKALAGGLRKPVCESQ